MQASADYQKLISEIVHKQIDILGPDMAVRKANNVQGLKVSADGEGISIGGDPQEVLQQLVSEYVALSGEIVKNILSPVLAKYPEIKLDLK